MWINTSKKRNRNKREDKELWDLHGVEEDDGKGYAAHNSIYKKRIIGCPN